MKYMVVRWIHDFANEPVQLFSEMDDAGREVRKVEVFRDGTRQRAGRGEENGSTFLSEAVLPALDVIASDPAFEPAVISPAEFEHEWNLAIQRK